MMYMNARAFPEIMIEGSYMIAKIEIHQLIDIICISLSRITILSF